MSKHAQNNADQPVEHPVWGAVFAMAMGVLSLVTAEFLPASLLTPMATGLQISEGLAGQAVTITAAVALITSLTVSALTKGIDRKYVLLAFSLLLVISNLFVAFATGFTSVFIGRILLGIALGGFWTMAAATTMRLVPEALVPRALSIIFSGLSIATLAAAPLGSYFEAIYGWRVVFMVAGALGVITFITQLVTLPALPAKGSAGFKTIVQVLMRPGVALAMLSATLVFTGHFIFFTYLRGSLEQMAGVSLTVIPAILLGYGIANFIGTSLSGGLIEKNLRLILIMMPVLMAVLGSALVFTGSNVILDATLVAIWGLAFGAVPVAWSAWVTRTVPDEAESAGGLIVAAIQLAITIGAATGGIIFDKSGFQGVFLSAASTLIFAALVITLGVSSRPAVPQNTAKSFH